LSITPRPPDLRVVSVTSPAAAKSGENLTISWLVSNASSGAVPGLSWDDTVYLSPSAAGLDGAIYFGSFGHNGPLAPGSNYVGSATIMLPYVFSGTYYVWVMVDSAANVSQDPDRNNNAA